MTAHAIILERSELAALIGCVEFVEEVEGALTTEDQTALEKLQQALNTDPPRSPETEAAA